MMGDVFVEVRQNQQQLEHPVALIRIRLGGAFFEIFHNRQRIRKQPFQVARIHGAALAAAIEGAIGPQERFVKKVIETQSFGGQSCGNRIGARSFAATPRR